MEKITLYGYSPSPFVQKVAAFLYFKDLPFEFVPVNPLAASETIGFTGGARVPVLAIDDEWRLDSTPIGMWLDERFPETPLLPENQRQRARILSIDHWLNEMFFPSFFRGFIDGPCDARFRARSWRYATLIDADTPLDSSNRNRWPKLQRSAPFLHDMIRGLDRDEPVAEMNTRLEQELLDHLGSGPFLGESPVPTLVDLALFPSLVFAYLVGIEDTIEAAKSPEIKAYVLKMADVLPENTTLVPDEFVVNRLGQ